MSRRSSAELTALFACAVLACAPAAARKGSKPPRLEIAARTIAVDHDAACTIEEGRLSCCAVEEGVPFDFSIDAPTREVWIDRSRVCRVFESGAAECFHRGFEEDAWDRVIRLPSSTGALRAVLVDDWGCVLDRSGAVRCFGAHFQIGRVLVTGAVDLAATAQVACTLARGDVHCWAAASCEPQSYGLEEGDDLRRGLENVGGNDDACFPHLEIPWYDTPRWSERAGWLSVVPTCGEHDCGPVPTRMTNVGDVIEIATDPRGYICALREHGPGLVGGLPADGGNDRDIGSLGLPLRARRSRSRARTASRRCASRTACSAARALMDRKCAGATRSRGATSARSTRSGARSRRRTTSSALPAIFLPQLRR